MNFIHPIKVGTLELKSNIIQAPLASYSNRAYRHLCAIYGSVLSMSEMVSVEGLLREGEKTLKLIKQSDEEKNGKIPFGVQLFGSNVQSFEKAVKVLLKHISVPLIDINAACPVKKVMKTGSGASLLERPKLIGEIVRTIKETSGKNVSIKIRIGINTNNINYLEVAEEAFKNGADMIALHARTASELYSGKADHTYTKRLKEEFKDKTIIASGDIFCTKDINDVIAYTKVDGVLAARGAIGNPFIFTNDTDIQTDSYIKAFKEQINLCEYYNDCSLRELRKFTPYYFKHIKKSNTKDIRIALSTSASTKNEFLSLLNKL